MKLMELKSLKIKNMTVISTFQDGAMDGMLLVDCNKSEATKYVKQLITSNLESEDEYTEWVEVLNSIDVLSALENLFTKNKIDCATFDDLSNNALNAYSVADDMGSIKRR